MSSDSRWARFPAIQRTPSSAGIPPIPAPHVKDGNLCLVVEGEAVIGHKTLGNSELRARRLPQEAGARGTAHAPDFPGARGPAGASSPRLREGTSPKELMYPIHSPRSSLPYPLNKRGEGGNVEGLRPVRLPSSPFLEPRAGFGPCLPRGCATPPPARSALDHRFPLTTAGPIAGPMAHRSRLCKRMLPRAMRSRISARGRSIVPSFG